MLCARNSGHKKHSSSAMIAALPYNTMVAVLVLCLLSPLLVASQAPQALTCMQGYGADKTSKTCDDGLDACVTITDDIKLTDPNASATTFYTCDKKESCSNAFTISIGDKKYLHHTLACCAEANCNADLTWGVPPLNLTANGLVCPTGCFAGTEADCTGEKVSCRDAENTCFTAAGTVGTEKDAKTFILKGCGTSNVCGLKGKSVNINGTIYPVKNATCTAAKSSSINHVLEKSSFHLLLPSVSSLLFMKFLS